MPIADSRKAFEEFGGPPSEEGDRIAFVEWMVQDWIVPRFGRTVMEEFLRRRSSLTEEQAQRLRAWSQSFTGLHEIQDVSPGQGITVKNLLTGEEVFVTDVSASKIGARGDTLLVRVVETERGREFGGTALRIPREHLGALRGWMEKERSAAGLSWPEYMKRNLPLIRKHAVEIADNWIANLDLRNNDGEAVLFSNAVFRVMDETAFVDGMNAFPELQYDTNNQAWVWLRGPEDEQVVQAIIRRAGDQVRLECNSKERLARGKDLLVTIAGARLRHLRDEFTTTESIKRAVRENRRLRPRAPNDIPPEVEQAVLEKILDQHYDKWIDMPLPALDGETPRAAVNDPEGRRKVIAVMRELEDLQEADRRKGGPSYEFTRVREALGLDEE